MKFNLSDKQYSNCFDSLGVVVEATHVKDGLIENGLISPLHIAQMQKKEFVGIVGEKLNICENEAVLLYQKSQKVSHKVTHLFYNLKTTIGSDYYGSLMAKAVGVELKNEFEKMPSYQELFESLDYCEGEDYNSIFGPCAYFVDLMRLVDLYITKANKSTIPSGYTLNERRPDLENLLLNKSNAEDMVAYITIANKILAENVRRLLSVPDPFQAMSTLTYPFKFPVNIPLEEIRSTLKNIGMPLYKIYEYATTDRKAVEFENLQISKDVVSNLSAPLYTSQKGDTSKLCGYYGMKQAELINLEKSTTFLTVTAIDQSSLFKLLQQNLTEDEKNVASLFFINRGLNGSYLNINDNGIIEFIVVNKTANYDVLERINRFIRISNLFGLSYEHTDWLIQCLSKNKTIDENFIYQATCTINLYNSLKSSLKIDFYDFMSLFGQIKTYGYNCKFDTLFNKLRNYHPVGALNTNYKDNVISWDINNDLTTSSWLSGSLSISISQLVEFARSLFGNAIVKLSCDNLSLMYRHCVLARMLGMDITCYFKLKALCAVGNELSFEDISKLLDYAKKLKLYKQTVFHADYFVKGIESPFVKIRYSTSTIQGLLKYIWNLNETERTKSVVSSSLADFFAVDLQTIENISCFFPAFEKNKTWQDAFLFVPKEGESPYFNYIEKIFLSANRWLNVMDAKVPLPLIKSISENPNIYGFNSFENMTIENFLIIFDFNAFFDYFMDENYKLLACIKLDTASLKILSDVTGWDNKNITSLVPKTTGNIVNRLNSLIGYFSCMSKLNADISLIEKIALLKDMPVNKYTEIRDIGETLKNKLNSYQILNLSEAAKRDCLLSIACWKLNYDRNTLYKFLLVDVEMGEITQISYIREGINALQLYLQRCRMGLEPGVLEIGFDEDYWSWIMSFSMWQANRQLFVYPENYLVPSIRRTKTTAFKELESGLSQSSINNDYVEGLVQQYIESISSVAEINICSAYQKGKDLFLFGRTKQQPYTFYFCKRANNIAWSEWKKIDGTINSPDITPVFAFGKLFIFWVETRKFSQSIMDGQKTKEVTTYYADIKYIKQNVQGRFSPPQDLIKDEIIYCCEDGVNNSVNKKAFKGLFDIDLPEWKRVSVIPISAQNCSAFCEVQENFERICVLYGPRINTVTVAESITLPTEKKSKEELTFDKKMQEILKRYNSFMNQGINGNMVIGYAGIFNSDLKKDFITNEFEYPIFDEYAVTKTGCAAVSQVSFRVNSIGLCPSTSPITDTYLNTKSILQTKRNNLESRCFISDGIDSVKSQEIYDKLKDKGIIIQKTQQEPQTVDVGKLMDSNLLTLLYEEKSILTSNTQHLQNIENSLLNNAQSSIFFTDGIRPSARIIRIFNQPGSFIFDNGDEMLLFDAKGANEKANPFQLIDMGLTVRAPLISVIVFKNCKDTKVSSCAKDIIDCLVSKGIVSKNGVVDVNKCTVSTVRDAIKDIKIDKQPANLDEKLVHAIVMNYPVVKNDAFISAEYGIGQALSEKIYNVFDTGTLIISERLILGDLFFTVPQKLFKTLLADKTITNEQLDKVYELLSAIPIPIALNYTNSKPVNFSDLRFEVSRVSTGAVGSIKRKVESGGIKALFDINNQNTPIKPLLPLSRYKISNASLLTLPKQTDGGGADFEGLYGEYFWELFFHSATLVAENLKSGSNELCMSWLKIIFDPSNKERVINDTAFNREAPDLFSTDVSKQIRKILLDNNVIDANGHVKYDFKDLSALSKILPPKSITAVENILRNYILIPSNSFYWNFFPFRQHTIEKMLDILNDDSPAMAVYNDDPFNPHAIARLRIGAYEKYVIMQYIENIIAWGDSEFVKNTWESITLASMFYIMASDLLGKKPAEKGRRKSNPPISFKDIKDKYKDDIPQFLIILAAKLYYSSSDFELNANVPVIDVNTYFSVPENENLFKLWDTIEDRLYKIRNFLDINGNLRTMNLFEQSADPMAVARVAASSQGVQGTLISQTTDPYPYRFKVLIEHAKNLVGRLMAISSQTLALLEKKDSEEFLKVSANNESVLLNLTTQIKESQIAELEKNLESLDVSLGGAKNKASNFNTLITNGLSSKEITSLEASESAFEMGVAANAIKVAAGVAHLIPQVGSPFAMTYGGIQVGSALSAVAGGIEIGASIKTFTSQRSSTMAGYQRREDEWQFQKKQADFDVSNIEKQIELQKLKIENAKRELDIHKRSIEQKNQVLTYLKSKFTSADLYQWMIGRLSTIMWQTYQYALELSLIAQAAYQQERDSDENFLLFDSFSTQHKGLLSGENLMLALDLMQLKYLKERKRFLEAEKHFSLALNCPKEFLELKSTGHCSFELTEELFDYDYPGAYDRKIISVSVTIPAVVGPYQNIKAILTQNSNTVILKPDIGAVKFLLDKESGNPPSCIKIRHPADQRIAVSKGVDDSGVYTLNFGDDLYLPFEGTGAVSKWTFDMPKNTNRFNFDSISDVILHIKYQSLYDGKLKDAVESQLSSHPYSGGLYYSLKQNFLSRWNDFMNDETNLNFQSLRFPMSPVCACFGASRLTSVYLKLNVEGNIKESAVYQIFSIKLPGDNEKSVTTKKDVGALEGFDCDMEDAKGEWEIKFDLNKIKNNADLNFILSKSGKINPQKLSNIEMLLLYEANMQ